MTIQNSKNRSRGPPGVISKKSADTEDNRYNLLKLKHNNKI